MGDKLIPYSLLIIGIALYFIYTIRYYKVLRHSIYFSGGIKKFHLIAIWLIPFIWILFLKGITKTTPGSFEIKKKSDDEPWSNPYSAPTDVTVD